jgi:hypothetical protein
MANHSLEGIMAIVCMDLYLHNYAPKVKWFKQII